MAKRGAPLGNNNPSKNKPWADAIRKAVIQADGATLHKIAQALLDKAGDGDIQAIKELGDRLDGKPHQTIAAEVDSTVTVEIMRFGASKTPK